MLTDKIPNPWKKFAEVVKGNLTLSKLRYIINSAQSTPPTSPSNGDYYMDDGTNTGDSNAGLRQYTNGAWQDVGGGVAGPASSTDNAPVRWDGTGGETLQDTPGITLDDGGNVHLNDDIKAYLGTGDDYSLTYDSANDQFEIYDEGANSVILTIESDGTINAQGNKIEQIKALLDSAQSSPPSTPSNGDFYMDDGTNTGDGNASLRQYTNGAWEDVGAGGGGVSNPMTEDLDAGGNSINNQLSLNSIYFVNEYADSGSGTSGDPWINALENIVAQETSGWFKLLPGYYEEANDTIYNSNTFIEGYGATVTLKDSASITGGLFRLQNSHIAIVGLTVDGNKANQGANTWQNIKISNTDTHNIFLRDLKLKNASEDNIYIGLAGDHPHDIWIDNATCDAANRSNMSITDAKRVWVKNSRFTGASGSAPEDGIDLEPNSATDWLENIYLENVVCDNNAGRGLSVLGQDLASQGNIKIKNCKLISNSSFGMELREVHAIKILGGGISNNTSSGVYAANNWQDILFQGTTIEGNGSRGIDFADSGRTTNISGLVFDDLTIKNNADHGIFVSENDTYTITGIIIANCHIYDDQATVTQGRPVFISPSSGNIDYMILVNNLFHGNDLGYANGIVNTTDTGNLEWNIR